ncbi:hypothetical protein PSU4_11590 [Pseudonocardia sulfidoxydans NBRC 16205]|uniref:DUF1622 domain-containing protein n=1 Tax=Pseudonocardia sulfidoxydans NBRC 16205 TaxID=1223511 RepID=A0A511DBM3_9PSEU|nr:DUF1622 domain-containing protein [Pseudonocardia sulfidoxydans]GEL22205.1 hypothetical protein PSU4_11590 [Pseudonocardia sulfidoxydans NBRC 16205]
MTLVEVMEHTATAFEILGAATLVAGTVLAVALAIRVLVRSRGGRPAYLTLREAFGGALLLSVEILVAADLLRTVAVTPTVTDVVVLGLIVLIRTFLSFSLEIELEGVPPWRRALVTGAGHLAAATARARERAAPPRS